MVYLMCYPVSVLGIRLPVSVARTQKNARREVGPLAPSRPPTPAPENVGHPMRHGDHAF